MQIIILGCGRVGSSLAARLMQLNHEVVVVEQDPVLLSNIDDLDCVKIVGHVIDRSVLEKAGIETADAVCVVTNNENMNIMAAEICQRIYHMDRVFARTFQPSNSDVFDEMGLDTVSGTELIVNQFIHELRASKTAAFIDLYHRSLRFHELAINDAMVGRSFHSVSTELNEHIFACLRDGDLILAQSDILIQEADRLVIAKLESGPKTE